MSLLQPEEPKSQIDLLVRALDEHRINTLGELRRVERLFATLGDEHLTEPMTSACEFQFASVLSRLLTPAS